MYMNIGLVSGSSQPRVVSALSGFDPGSFRPILCMHGGLFRTYRKVLNVLLIRGRLF